jgi:hypothetical protein
MAGRAAAVWSLVAFIVAAACLLIGEHRTKLRTQLLGRS